MGRPDARDTMAAGSWRPAEALGQGCQREFIRRNREVRVKVLVLGGGQIARAVGAAASPQHQLVTRTRTDLDIVDERAVVRTLLEIKPDWVVNAAAFTAVDLAEEQPAQAHAVNDTAVGCLARASAREGCRLLHLSTDFVFDGNTNRAYLPTDKPMPLSV